MNNKIMQLNQSIILKVDGNFDLKDFIEILKVLDFAYNRLNTILYISDEFDVKIKRFAQSERHSIILNPIETYNLGGNYYNNSFIILSKSAINYTTTLKLGSVNINSPGLIELVGNLNPLKVIADFITTWRKENTLREDNYKKWEFEEKKLKVELIKSIIERFDKLYCTDSFIEYFIDYGLNESLEKLIKLSKDSRIESIKLIEKDNTEQNARS